MKKQIKCFVSIALSAISLLCTVACNHEGSIDSSVSDVGNGEYVAPIIPDAVVHAGGSYKMNGGKTIGFLSSEIEPLSDDSATVEGLTVQLTAMVEPADAWDKSVDWSFAWADDTPEQWSSKTVEDYIKIEPLSDGSTTANVTLMNYYHECAITITVTTRDGGFKSSCDATCVSEYYRTEITIQGDIAGTDSLGHEYYELYSGDRLSFVFDHFNKFGYPCANPGGLHSDIWLYGRFNDSNGETIKRVQSTALTFNPISAVHELTTSFSSTDFSFYSSTDLSYREPLDYLNIYINNDGYGDIHYRKPFDSNFLLIEPFTTLSFKSFDLEDEVNHLGGIEFAFTYFCPTEIGYAYVPVTETIYIRLRTSVSSVSLSAKNLALK